MIQQRISEWIQHPESLGEESLQELRALLERYPYFQTAWVLYLKNLYLLKDEAFREELRRGALYVADLGVLFYYIEGDRFVIQKHAEERPASDVSDRTLDLIDRFLSESTEPLQTPKEIPLTMEVNLDYTSVLMNSEDGTSADGTETPQLRGQELIDSFIARDRAGDVSAAQQEISRTPDEDAEILPDAPSGEGRSLLPKTWIHRMRGKPQKCRKRPMKMKTKAILQRLWLKSTSNSRDMTRHWKLLKN